MSYTQTMADQNKAMANRAKILLDKRGWNPDLEEQNSFRQLTGPQLEIIKGVVKTIATEFEVENISLKRIRNRVFSVCRKERGRLWRLRQNQ